MIPVKHLQKLKKVLRNGKFPLEAKERAGILCDINPPRWQRILEDFITISRRRIIIIYI